jgi:hypothetical protein
MRWTLNPVGFDVSVYVLPPDWGVRTLQPGASVGVAVGLGIALFPPPWHAASEHTASSARRREIGRCVMRIAF